jgi:hypothetical protein
MFSHIYQVIAELDEKSKAEKKVNVTNFLIQLRNQLNNYAQNPTLDKLQNVMLFLKKAILKKNDDQHELFLKNIYIFLNGLRVRMTDTPKSSIYPDIYQLCKKFGGEIMLPIQQQRDYRFREGQCQGIIAYWARRFLESKPVSGIHAEGNLTFKPLPFQAVQLFKDINHLLPITHEARELQSRQREKSFTEKILRWKFLMYFRDASKIEEVFPLSTDQKVQSQFSVTDITQSDKVPIDEKKPQEIAERFLRSVKEDKNKQSKVYFINLLGDESGHTMCFAVNYDNKNQIKHLHFVDANSGWYRFKPKENFEQNFKLWFQELYKKMYMPNKKFKGYESYTMFSYSLKQTVKLAQEPKPDVKPAMKYAKDDLFFHAKREKKPSKIVSKDDIELRLHKKR